MKLRIATRKSPLALAQTHWVRDQLIQLYPELKIEIIGITTAGDVNVDQSLAKIGGKGLFLKELEQALLEGEADIAVHSMKDVPTTMPEGLVISCILKREDPRDVLVCPHAKSLNDLSKGAVVGTSSVRRQFQLLQQRPDLKVEWIRGNVETRLNKLAHQKFDALILAAAGLHRLHLENHISSYLPIQHFIPAIGQGAIGIECCEIDTETQELLESLADWQTTECVLAERAVGSLLGASCDTPLGVYATIHAESIALHGFLADIATGLISMSSVKGAIADKDQLAEALVNQLEEPFR